MQRGNRTRSRHVLLRLVAAAPGPPAAQRGRNAGAAALLSEVGVAAEGADVAVEDTFAAAPMMQTSAVAERLAAAELEAAAAAAAAAAVQPVLRTAALAAPATAAEVLATAAVAGELKTAAMAVAAAAAAAAVVDEAVVAVAAAAAAAAAAATAAAEGAPERQVRQQQQQRLQAQQVGQVDFSLGPSQPPQLQQCLTASASRSCASCSSQRLKALQDHAIAAMWELHWRMQQHTCWHTQ